CAYGRKRPFYGFQNVLYNDVRASRSSACLLTETYDRYSRAHFAPSVSHDLYIFLDGAQDDIFEDSYINCGTEPGRDASTCRRKPGADH
ncbi:hypothetical protein EI94DRAFT_1712855, partial [Lactarius quietus]